MRGSVLIVDDQPTIRLSLGRCCESEGHTVFEAECGEDGVALFARNDPDIVLLDLKLPDLPGLQVLKRIRETRPDAMVIIVTSQTDVRFAVEAMKAGAFDYLSKPVDMERLKILLERGLQMQKTARELDHLRQGRRDEYGEDFVVSDGSAMRPILDVVRQVAESDTTSVLIEGESGTGKELVAHYLHRTSPRAAGPMLEINCASLPEQLLESELFGHEKGAFTDARTQKKGLLEMADGGTLFLDEVGEMSLTVQVKLLRVLEKMTFRRVGGLKDIEVSVRIISATNRDLQEEVGENRFREDLYYRLKVVPLELPPLRERPGDIPLLAEHFMRLFNGRFNRSLKGFTPEAADALLSYRWPGNIREMRNLIERTVLLGKGERIDIGDLNLPVEGAGRDNTLLGALGDALDGRIPGEGFDLEGALRQIEEQVIRRVSERTNWNQTQSSRLLLMNRDKLRYRMKQYNLSGKPSVPSD